MLIKDLFQVNFPVGVGVGLTEMTADDLSKIILALGSVLCSVIVTTLNIRRNRRRDKRNCNRPD